MKLISESTLLVLSILFIYSCSNSNIKNEDKTIAESQKEAKSLQPNDHWYDMRSYPNGFNEALYLKKMDEQKTAITLNTQNRAVDLTMPWLEEGPGNIGGKFNVLEKSPVDDNIIYAGATNGGIFKTINGGSTWNPIFDDMSYLAIGSISIDPADENTIYVGTGDKNFGGGSHIGNGVYKSLDAGSTWNQIGLEQTGIITELVIDPVNSNNIYAATLGNPYAKTNDRGVYKSIDGGLNWNNVLFLSDSSGVIDLIMDPSNPNVLYASGFNRINLPYQSKVTGPESKIYKTIDGGNNWTQLGGGLPMTDESRVGLAISEIAPHDLYAIYVDGDYLDIKDIYKSTDAGTNWNSLNVTNNGLDDDYMGGFGWYFGEVYVNPYNFDHLVVTGVELFESSDGGQTWQQNAPDWWTYEVHADKHDVLFLDATSYIIATDGGLYETTDNGQNWTDIENIAVTQFYHIDVDPHNSGIYGGGAQDNGTMSGNSMSFNNWQRIYGGDGFRITYLENDPGAMYLETQRGGINYYDGAANINLSPDLNNDRTNWDTPYIINEDDEELFVGTSRINLMEFAPNGSYYPVSNDLTKVGLGTSTGSDGRHTITEIEQANHNSDLLFVGTSDGLVWKGIRTNGIWDWINVTGNLPDRYVTGVKSSPNPNNNMYVCFSGYTFNDYQSYLYKSDDLGQSWIDISGDLPDIPVNDILVVPGENDNYIFAALDGGVYFTENGGVNWDYVGVGIPLVTANELRLDIPNQKLIVGTYSRSMYSYDVSWLENLNVDYTSVNENKVNELSIYPNPVIDVVTIKNVEQGIINLFNNQGQLIMTYDNKELADEVKINLSQLPTGIYFYELNEMKGIFSLK
jgi:photosystem II stability/assembly factor-like uncharacterized protein